MPQQNLPGPHSGARATITPGDTLARSMGQYGKGFAPQTSFGLTTTDPVEQATASPPTKTATPLMRPRPEASSGPNGSQGSPRDYANADGSV